MTEKAKNNPLFEALFTNIEVFAKSLSNNEMTKSIPIVGTAYQVVRGIDDIRSRVLAKKLHDFLTAPELQNDESKAKIKKKIEESPDEATKIGETLFLVIERIVDLRKPQLLSRVFMAYVDGEINSDELQRFSETIDATYAGDLDLMCSDKLTDAVLENLISTGLAKIEHTAVLGGFDSMDYQLSKHGKKLRDILVKYNRA